MSSDFNDPVMLCLESETTVLEYWDLYAKSETIMFLHTQSSSSRGLVR